MAAAPFTRRVVDSPDELGLDTDAIAEVIARAQREIDEGHVPSCQIAFARDGRLAVWVTLGDAAPESRYLIFSSTKPVVAAAPRTPPVQRSRSVQGRFAGSGWRSDCC